MIKICQYQVQDNLRLRADINQEINDNDTDD